jgi:hypothetical protein
MEKESSGCFRAATLPLFFGLSLATGFFGLKKFDDRF